jgi:genome maintenance exonuclease 1
MSTSTLIQLPKHKAQCTWYQGRQYYSFQGSVYTGVTTVLSATRSSEDEQRFKDWEEKVGRQEAQRIRKESTQRGKVLHRQIEGYLNGHVTEHDTAVEEYQNYWQSINPLLEQIEEAYLVEGAVWHPYGFAGVVDALVNLNGELWICDWKTSTKLKKWSWIEDYCLQVAAYTAAVNRVYRDYGIRVSQAMVAIALPQTEAQIFRIEREALMEYWEMFQQRLEQFKAVQ